MRALQPSRHTRARIAPGIHDVLAVMMLRLIQQRLDARLGEAPRAGIQGLLLGPHDGLGVGVGVEVFTQLGPGKRVELFDAGDGGGGEVFVGGAVFVQRGVDLAGAEDDAVDFVVRFDCRVGVGGVGDDPLEVGVAGEVFDRGAGEGVAEEGFGKEEDQSWKVGTWLAGVLISTWGRLNAYVSGIGDSFVGEGCGNKFAGVVM